MNETNADIKRLAEVLKSDYNAAIFDFYYSIDKFRDFWVIGIYEDHWFDDEYWISRDWGWPTNPNEYLRLQVVLKDDKYSLRTRSPYYPSSIDYHLIRAEGTMKSFGFSEDERLREKLLMILKRDLGLLRNERGSLDSLRAVVLH